MQNSFSKLIDLSDGNMDESNLLGHDGSPLPCEFLASLTPLR